MLTFHIKLKHRCYGNWIINLSVLLCNSNIIISQPCDSKNDSDNKQLMPANWPCQWNDGVIPFAFDFFSMSPKRLINQVRNAHIYLQARSCLTFKEQDPKVAAKKKNFTYLFYTYSEALEKCCLPFFTKGIGRRPVLITPECSLPNEIAHGTLHALGLTHPKYDTFTDSKARAVMFPSDCAGIEQKLDMFTQM